MLGFWNFEASHAESLLPDSSRISKYFYPTPQEINSSYTDKCVDNTARPERHAPGLLGRQLTPACIGNIKQASEAQLISIIHNQ